MLPLCDHCLQQSYHLENGLCLVCHELELERNAEVLDNSELYSDQIAEDNHGDD